MREIKFKAWHKEKKIWFPVIAIGLMDGWVELMPAPDSSWVTYIENVDLVQSTGRLDCNGEEIYEGHVVKSNMGTCVVVYREASYYAVLNPNGMDEVFNLTDYEWEIIGDKYRNPELI